jgi:hypothetical protein
VYTVSVASAKMAYHIVTITASYDVFTVLRIKCGEAELGALGDWSDAPDGDRLSRGPGPCGAPPRQVFSILCPQALSYAS